ncbi:MAG: hypothetical protein GXY41_00890 [Phycisphaerae bacterium]|nr:hypothetical protein [Phycisphaerae bacterium]
MKTMIMCMVAATILLSATGVAIPVQKEHLPASAKWVFHVNFQTFEESTLGRLVSHEIQAHHQSKLDAIKQLTGSDPLTDIYALTVVGPDSNEANAVALIYGTFNRPQLLAILAQAPAYRESKHGDQTLYHWQEPKRGIDQVGAFAHDNLIIIGQTQKAVTEILDVWEGRVAALTAETNPSLWQLTQWSPKAFMAAAATNLPELTKEQQHAAILRNSQSISLMAIEEQGDLRLSATLESSSVEAAEQIELFARGMLSYAMLNQQVCPELDTLIQASSLTRTNSTITFDFRIPPAKLIDIAKTSASQLKLIVQDVK